MAPPTNQGKRKTSKPGSGLSLDRFIQGKRRPTKSLTKKRKLNTKAVQLRNYRNLSQRETTNAAKTSTTLANGQSRFYDQFFQKLEDAEEEESIDQPKTEDRLRLEEHHEPMSKSRGTHQSGARMNHRPDPFFRAKCQAKKVQVAQRLVREQQEQEQARRDQKISQRKKKHVKHNLRTSHGQPRLQTHIQSVLEKLSSK